MGTGVLGSNVYSAIQGYVSALSDPVNDWGIAATRLGLQKAIYNEVEDWHLIQPIDSNYVGRLHIIPEANRPANWILSGGNDTSFTDVDFSAYAPAGTEALLLKYLCRWNGDGVIDSIVAHLRKNGSSETDLDRVTRASHYYTNAGAGVLIGHGSYLIVLCDSDRKIEYKMTDAAGEFYLNIDGYFIPENAG